MGVKICANCTHVRANAAQGGRFCSRPITSEIDIINGGYKKRLLRLCEDERNDSEGCGIKGRFYEAADSGWTTGNNTVVKINFIRGLAKPFCP